MYWVSNFESTFSSEILLPALRPVVGHIDLPQAASSTLDGSAGDGRRIAGHLSNTTLVKHC